MSRCFFSLLQVPTTWCNRALTSTGVAQSPKQTHYQASLPSRGQMIPIHVCARISSPLQRTVPPILNADIPLLALLTDGEGGNFAVPPSLRNVLPTPDACFRQTHPNKRRFHVDFPAGNRSMMAVSKGISLGLGTLRITLLEVVVMLQL